MLCSRLPNSRLSGLNLAEALPTLRVVGTRRRLSGAEAAPGTTIHMIAEVKADGAGRTWRTISYEIKV